MYIYRSLFIHVFSEALVLPPAGRWGEGNSVRIKSLFKTVRAQVYCFPHPIGVGNGLASIGIIDKIVCLFCKRAP